MTELRRHKGFTLIEVAVVLVLTAMVASAVAVSARGMVGGATRSEVLAQIESIDAHARRHARLTGRAVQIDVDVSGGLITLAESGKPNTTPLAAYQLPGGYRLSKAWAWRLGRRDGRQQLVVHYDEQGRSSDWGVCVKSPEPQPAAALLIVGASGQAITLENDEEVQDILAQARRRHPN